MDILPLPLRPRIRPAMSVRSRRRRREALHWWCTSAGFGNGGAGVGVGGGVVVGARGLLTMSHAAGPTEPPLVPHSIPRHFAAVVACHGDRLALISRAQRERLTYRELDERSTVLAHALRARGVRKGDRVVVMLGNSWECGVVSYAVFKLGAILVPLNPAFNCPQVSSAISHLSAAHLILSTETNLPFKSPRENITLLKQICPDLSSSKVESSSVPSLRNIILVDNSSARIDTSPWRATTPFSALLSSYDSKRNTAIVPDEQLKPSDTINIQFTSGTTSAPKAACLTHTGILNNGLAIGTRMGLGPTDIVCCPPPLFHCFGSILGYMATATTGAALLLPSEAFDPRATLRAVQEEQATALYGVATMFVAELELLATNAVPSRGFDHLRTGIAAGSSVPRPLMEKLHASLNLTGLTICYGMTETSPVSCMTTPDDPLAQRLESVGRLLPHVEAKIVSVADGRSTTLPVGERGELVVSGYHVMKGYWNDGARTAAVRVVERVVEGAKEEEEEEGKEKEKEKVWMSTGDEAEMDADGYVKITGRIKDLIIRGGENIHPLEIENALFGMDAVSEVSVAGVPDGRYGEVVAAFVVVSQGVRVGVDDRGEGDPRVDAYGAKGMGGAGAGAGAGAARAGASGEEGQEGQGGDLKKVLTRDMVRTWVRERLSGHLVPRYVFWVRGYPKTASGKIQKFRLREMAAEWVRED
ncbi:uncharacterized protein L3040_008321 [Drepanopeziza brunnea f. sp. 'multigermtubi']|uniref:Putative acyl-CoA synthetase/AMP-acid ligase II n=1 Tax=Marssonina brunnea f. sp. multigermtubi (strain MB_m1) TaxID=1072389 RepID=K1WPN3_MARBU|nr:putative acyl-CoA synthetase/AMP-acid ligase II [Drepanopeziza brunnea f. sp. 'multigermtubi' MB_m1]EKD14327.1 putative acyl-CoA synthetase/AMP-acid ligase II [Drepanopeziza brunnea f. sp. 'multigermtubi' MB_m1]KAJ5035059.1 hypothetical protein L3040_008321 [Drepanopeziza brunnea f. sp. 'multigermtubi']